jgi:N4-(beta-N-acetylglucosaminyl)-L-asparaginase
MRYDRRRLLTYSGSLLGWALARRAAAQQPAAPAAASNAEGDAHRGLCAIGSANAFPSTAKAMELMQAGSDPLDAIVAGITIVEDDPNDMSVGYGGLPNEDGIVQLDASVMHGPSHRAGAVAALEDIKNPAQVALAVLKRTDHALLVGAGAKRFALALGFREENLLTEAAREAWLSWKANLNANDDWLDDSQVLHSQGERKVPYTTGTVHCSAVDGAGNLSACTSTSGMSYKLSGRVGDSPIVGAGMYCDNAIGSAGATGRGEAMIENCGAHTIVSAMERGLSPTAACLHLLERVVERTRRPHLLDQNGQPNFQLIVYALRKDGAFGSACLRGSATYAVHDGKTNRILTAPGLLPA